MSSDLLTQLSKTQYLLRQKEQVLAQRDAAWMGQIKALEENLNACNAERDRIVNSNRQMEVSMRRLGEESAYKCESMERRVAELTAEISNGRSDLAKLNDCLSKSESEKAACASRIRDLEGMLEEFRVAGRTKDESSRRDLARRDEQINCLNGELKKCVDKQREMVTRMTAELEKKDGAIAALQARQKPDEKLLRTIEEYRGINSRLKTEIESAMSEVGKLRIFAEESQRAKTLLEAKVTSLESRVAFFESSNGELLKSIEAMNDRLLVDAKSGSATGASAFPVSRTQYPTSGVGFGPEGILLGSSGFSNPSQRPGYDPNGIGLPSFSKKTGGLSYGAGGISHGAGGMSYGVSSNTHSTSKLNPFDRSAASAEKSSDYTLGLPGDVSPALNSHCGGNSEHERNPKFYDIHSTINGPLSAAGAADLNRIRPRYMDSVGQQFLKRGFKLKPEKDWTARVFKAA